MPEHFDKLLLDHIRNGRNDEAKAMLNEELARTFDDSDSNFNGTLLHHAAEHNNVEIARRLIELGADVDRFAGIGSTPLTVAVENESAATVQVLLEAGARIDIVDDADYSALQQCLVVSSADGEVYEWIIQKLRTMAKTNEEFAEILIRARCGMYHAAKLRDFELMECMLKRGVDVSLRNKFGETALHLAVELNDVQMADWLVNKGIDVDAFDDEGYNVLMKSVQQGNRYLVQLLLDNGACPEIQDHYYTPLYAAFCHLEKGPDGQVDCAELLLQHGASLPSSEDLREAFYYAVECSCDKAAKLLIAHLVMLEKLGKPVNNLRWDHRHRTKIRELWKYYEPCQQVLAIKMFQKLSLLELLKVSDRKMRLLIRKETFSHEVEKVSSEHKLSELYSYYYNTLMRRIEKASQVVKLEDEAILVICRVFETNYNQFYEFARGVVEYLNERDLENLVQVGYSNA